MTKFVTREWETVRLSNFALWNQVFVSFVTLAKHMLLPEVTVLVASGQVNQGVGYGMEIAAT
jgi:hypothetical protein